MAGMGRMGRMTLATSHFVEGLTLKSGGGRHSIVPALIRCMTLIDFILNIVGLLLWLNWRAAELPVTGQPGTSLLSTLRPAKPPQPRFYYWAGLPVLLAGRAVYYWQAGRPSHLRPQIPLGPTILSFRSDLPGRMFLFSVLSFSAALGVFYFWLLFLSWVNGQVPN